MNFFEAQEDARRATFRLVALFVLAVASLIVLTDLLVVVLLYAGGDTAVQTDFRQFARALEPGVHVTVAVMVLLVIAGGTLVRTAQLRAGGHVVADMLGGQAVPHNTRDPVLRRYVNVVEEMAIASGVAAPRLYVLKNEDGINAFAAGMTTDDAVIGVTQGCLELLDRDRLQGVIAHEFSHILNGDMRLNSRIAGVLFGILLLGLAGLRLLRIVSYRRVGASRGGGRSAAALAMLGGGLAVVGFGGTFFGNIIKATINRQREYLADASAVQFTRNPQGIAGALKAIGGYGYGSRVLSPAAPEASHFFFAAGVSPFFAAFFATHPPLSKRIRRIDPGWDGAFPAVAPAWLANRKTEELTDGGREPAQSGHEPAIAVAGALDRLAAFEFPDGGTIAYARNLVAAIPVALQVAAREPFEARALICALLLDSDPGIRRRQLEVIRDRAEEGVFGNLGRLHKLLTVQPATCRLPLVEITVPTLQSLSPPQQRRFLGVMTALIRADNHISAFEWVVTTVVGNAVQAGPGTARPAVFDRHLQQHAVQLRVVLSLVAWIHADGEAGAGRAFAAGADAARLKGAGVYPAGSLQFETVNNALKLLDRLAPSEKKRLLAACIEVAKASRNIDITEIEVIRAIAAAVHCPMPPLAL